MKQTCQPQWIWWRCKTKMKNKQVLEISLRFILTFIMHDCENWDKRIIASCNWITSTNPRFPLRRGIFFDFNGRADSFGRVRTRWELHLLAGFLTIEGVGCDWRFDTNAVWNLKIGMRSMGRNRRLLISAIVVFKPGQYKCKNPGGIGRLR